MAGRKPKEKATESNEITVCFETGEEIRGEDKQMITKALALHQKMKALEKQYEPLKQDLKSMFAGKGGVLVDGFKMLASRKETIVIDDPDALMIALGEDKFQAAVKVETTYKPTDWLKEKLKTDTSSQIRLASKCCVIKESVALEFKLVN